MEELSENTLDLSNQKLKKLSKPSQSESHVINLILDDNELQRLDNIDSFTKLQKLTAIHNQLLRMYGVCRLHSLYMLNLSHNGILTIEGLKDLVNLKWLCLAGNSIKTIEHLNTNIKLEHLDLSENAITHITDLSFLKNLKELFLHKNKINHLSQCERFLPISLTTLTLANNNIGDLNEISRLVNLVNLKKISIAYNPCVNMTGNNIGFDYRPFVVNWCLNVNVIDDYVVDAIESLRAEWLYSQGRGRHYRVGDQRELVQYLATVCPLTGETLEKEDDRKLRLILSKAQHHQQQLREQSSTNATPNPSPISRKRIMANKQSPRLSASRLNNRNKSPDKMSSSCHSTISDFSNQSVMSQSLDPSIFRLSVSPKITSEANYIIQEKCLDSEPVNSPLQALSKMVPVPESLMSPDYHPPPFAGRNGSVLSNLVIPSATAAKTSPTKIAQTGSPKSVRTIAGRARNQLRSDIRKCGSPSPARRVKAGDNGGSKSESNKKTSILRNRSPSSEEDSEMCNAKLQTIQMKVEERRIQKEEITSNCSSEDKVEQAAVCIQRMWRGFYIRNKNKEVQEMFRELQNQRANQYIQKLATDMETTKAALESERKIQMLQTEAISALWKKISNLQPLEGESASSANLNMTNLSASNGEVVKELAQTCTMLQTQIQQLQCSMQDIVKVMNVFSQTAGMNHQFRDNGIATQTEIVAVHTPQGEAARSFPFQKPQSRPSSLPLPVHQRKKEPPQANAEDPEAAAATSDLHQFAGSLVDGVIRTVSETRADCLGHDVTEITVTDTGRNADEDTV